MKQPIKKCPWCGFELLDARGYHISHTYTDCPRGNEWKDLSFAQRREYAEKKTS